MDSKLGTLLPPAPPPAPATHTTVQHQVSSFSKESDFIPAELFEGDLDQCGDRLAFFRSPSLFPDHMSRLTFTVNSLKWKALRWAHTFLQSHSIEKLTFQCFLQVFRRVFDHPLQQEATAKRILTLRQGRKSIANYSVDFRITAEEAGWDNQSLKGLFTNSLMIWLIWRSELTTAFESARGRRTTIPISLTCLPSAQLPPLYLQKHTPELDPEPMQLGRARLTQEERMRRLEAK